MMQENWTHFLELIPKAPDWNINWEAIEKTEVRSFAIQMKETQQSPIWHGEGDVWTHTRMVCQELVQMEDFRNLARLQQQELFTAALLHDIGKIPCTRFEDGKWTSPNHAVVGSRMAREFLWKLYGLSGTQEKRTFRETVCCLIRYHSAPPYIVDQKEPERKLIKMAANGELAEDFSIKLLCMLEKADMNGRIADTISESLEAIEFCEELAEEADCLYQSRTFPDAFSKYAYLSGRNIMPGQKLYNDTWGEVIMLSGLPGTGKDTWIQEHYADMPMISLDDLRRRMKISPTENQGVVVSAAREQAREYLRKKQPFIWNATNLTPLIRGKQIRLFQDYHAVVRIVFLETEWKVQLDRNAGRAAKVPEKVIDHMLSNLVLPERFEAHEVNWLCQ